MTQLSVNINKIATLRNARGGDQPNVILAATNCEKFGAQGITVHPRPDERHITGQDVIMLASHLKTEFNIEGYPDARYLQLCQKAQPAQCTLVPDSPDQLTSNHGWDTIKNQNLLTDLIAQIKETTTARVSLFVDADPKMAEAAALTGADRIELYTGTYANQFEQNKVAAIKPYTLAAQTAKQAGLGINAGHDLNLQNLSFFIEKIPFTDEVSIGHALIADALYFGLENTIQMYLQKIQQGLHLANK